MRTRKHRRGSLTIPIVLLFTAVRPTLGALDPTDPAAAPGDEPVMGWVRTQAGEDVEGTLVTTVLRFEGGDGTREIATSDLLSFHSATPASAWESEAIAKALEASSTTDVAAAEAACATLADIGLPVMTPLLRSYQDVDAHEPNPQYRLFARIVPGRADRLDRTLDLVRTADGAVFRAHWQPTDLELRTASGASRIVAASDVRRLAVLRDRVTRSLDLDALHDCTYVGFVDTGAVIRDETRLQADCAGYVRLSFDEDGWSCDPEGIFEPLPGKRKLQEGFRWGCVLGRVGTAGERFHVGKHLDGTGLGHGRLYLVVNDNEHWQNNIGSYHAQVTLSPAYDLSDPH